MDDAKVAVGFSAPEDLDGDRPLQLVGREQELGVIHRLIDHARQDSGGALLIRGDAGIGKSTLVAAARSRALRSAMQIMTATGVESESNLAFAALHQLLRPLLRMVDRLAPRQRAALLSGFGQSDGPPPELFLLSLAGLELLAEAAEAAPVLVIVEDAQWIDPSSAAVMAFVARRLEAERIAMLIAVRDGGPNAFDHSGLPELRLQGLNAGEARKLLDAQAPEIGSLLRRRILEEAAGNPLALVELPLALGSEDFAGAMLLPSRLPLTARLERAFAASEAELPKPTRSLLIVAAADESGDIGELLSAATIMEKSAVTIDAGAPAAAGRLVEIEGMELRFRHPLVRSAIYQAASASERQAAHAALAEALAADPDRSVWHRAAAAVGPTESIAVELEQAATRARRRGALAVAVAAQERAAQLSDGAMQRGRRLLRAAEMAFEPGYPRLGHRALQVAGVLELYPEDREWLSCLREVYDDTQWSAAKMRAVVALAEQVMMRGSHELASKILLVAALRSWWGNPDPQTQVAIVSAAERLLLADDDPLLLAILAHADPVGRGAIVIDRIAGLTPNGADPAAMYLVGAAANAAWAYDLALGFLATAIDGLRARGRVGLLAQALVAQSWAAVHQAREPLAVAAAEEAVRLAREIDEPRWVASALLAQATIGAERGDVQQADAFVREAEALLVPMGETAIRALVQFVRGRGAVAHQHYDEGFDEHRRTLDLFDPGYHPFIGAWGLSDLVEAAAHSGRPAEARAYLAQLESLVAQTSGPLLRAEASYARPMVAEESAAEALYQTAIDRELARWLCYRGRMLLWYGRWLRRQRRIADSRVPLRAARESFDALAFPGLAETARQELRASGETSRQRIREAWDQLSPQELQIAKMAAEGLSNREIAERLYISHRTVGYHLHRIFPKLGLTSRSQLQRQDF